MTVSSKLTRFEQVYGGLRLLDDLGLDLGYVNVVCVPVILVLYHGHAAGRIELGELVGTVVEQSIGTRSLIALLLYKLLLLRRVGKE